VLELKELLPGEEKHWDEIVKSSSQGTLFHLSKWLELLQECQGSRLLRYGIVEDARLIGIFPLYIKSLGPFRVAGSPLTVEDTPYLGPIVEAGRLTDVLVALESEMRKRHVHFIRVILPPGWTRPQVEQQGYHVVSKTSHTVDLGLGEDKIFANFEKNRKKKVRKAERLGVHVRWTQREEDWDQHYQLLSDLCRGQGRLPPNSRSFYRGLQERFEASGEVALVVSDYEGKVIAAQIYGLYKGVVYCLNEASMRDFRHVAPNDAKHWVGIRTYLNKGFRVYDIGNADTPPLAEYKRNFGGTEAEYFVLERSRSRLCSVFRRHYTRYRYFVMWMRLKLSPGRSVHESRV